MKALWVVLSFLVLGSIPLAGGPGWAQDQKDMGGWEIDGAYNRHYNLNEVDNFKATVVGFKTEAPMPGMSPAVILLVKESDGDDPIVVHICPLWFAKPQRMGVKKGDRVKIRGAWAEIDGHEVVMAAKVKKSEHQEFKVRKTSDGTPFWIMTPEQLAKETRAD